MRFADRLRNPLGGATGWITTVDPETGAPARRDPDTMDTFVDSSWYFLRFLSPGDAEAPFSAREATKWAPVDFYLGGVEHAILHLLYMRFFTKVLFDMGLVDFVEPMRRLLNQGQVINQGKAMSKSLGNGVDLGKQIDEFGVDAIRLTVVFAGPPEEDIDWADVSPAGSLKFLQRAYRLAADVTSTPGTDPRRGDVALRRQTHRLLADVTNAIETQRFNVAVARVMELVNAARRAIDSGPGAADPAVREAVEVVTVALSLVAPYAAEEMWERLGHTPSVADTTWPEVDASLLVADTVTCVLQVQGKVRGRLEVAPDVGEDELRAAALADEGVQRAIDGAPVRKVIVRAPKLVNIVV